jgi:hypothetical protein
LLIASWGRNQGKREHLDQIIKMDAFFSQDGSVLPTARALLSTAVPAGTVSLAHDKLLLPTV